ncbi:MAG: hypothetical protein HeimC3_50140 [Candidatus Heimdallarchaeota archaeon LC_3]|nr:MAG: hypothetical protein HeimC3_50140 [Candidatus Heimdallarchaeota archaeon LC_3]
MGINVAILIGISKYINFNDLPACKSDLNHIHNLIKRTEKYQENILLINEDSSSSEVKEQITSFVNKFFKQEIDEVLFYFSGHGQIKGTVFHYILSDFDKNELNKTSISNEELDQWLRELGAKMTFKIVDACHSGTKYIKNGDFEKQLEKATAFNKCYFLFSSSAEQVSLASKNISYFTKSFLKSFHNHKASNIRYNDIIDSIKDDFEGKEQNPFFIVQASMTEVFCEIKGDLRTFINEIFDKQPKESIITKIDSEKPQDDEEIKQERTGEILELIKKQAETFLSEEEFINLVNKFPDKINEVTAPKLVTETFEIGIEFLLRDFHEIPKLDQIGRWFAERQPFDFFAEVEYEEYEYDTKEPVWTFLSRESLDPPSYYQPVTKKGKKIIGIRSTAKTISKDTFIIKVNPKFRNIDSFNLTITFIYSKNEILFFHFMSNYEDKSWTDKVLVEPKEWKMSGFKLKNEEEIFEFLAKVLREYYDFLENLLINEFTHVQST